MDLIINSDFSLKKRRRRRRRRREFCQDTKIAIVEMKPHKKGLGFKYINELLRGILPICCVSNCPDFFLYFCQLLLDFLAARSSIEVSVVAQRIYQVGSCCHEISKQNNCEVIFHRPPTSSDFVSEKL